MFVISTLTKVLTHIDPENGKAQLAQVLSAIVALREETEWKYLLRMCKSFKMLVLFLVTWETA